MDSSSITLPSGQTSLTVSFDIKVTDLCSSSANVHFAVVTVGSTRFMDFYRDPDDSTITIRTETATAGDYKYIIYLDKPFVLNVWVTLIATLDTTALSYGGAIATPAAIVSGAGTFTTGTKLVTPDSTIKFNVCSDVGGTSPIGCQISNLKVIYQTYSQNILGKMAMGIEPTVIGIYKFKENTGYATRSDVSTLGTAYFGANTASTSDATNTPTWSGTDKALTFTATNQYLTIPTFSLAPSNNRAKTASLSIHFWFKVTVAPTNGDTIFTWTSSSSPSTTRISVDLYNALHLGLSIVNLAATEPTAARFSLSTWVEVIANFLIFDEYNTGKTFVSVYFGGNRVIEAFADATLFSTTFQASDRVRIGGFVGQFADLRIYSPGAHYISTTPCTSGCSFDLGITKPATCFQPDCGSGGYASACITCPASCTSCSANSICRTCPAGSGLTAGSCITCTGGTSAPTFSSPCKAPTVIVAGNPSTGINGGVLGVSTTTTINYGNIGNIGGIGGLGGMPSMKIDQESAGIVGYAVAGTVMAAMLFVGGYFLVVKKLMVASNAGNMGQFRVNHARIDQNQSMSVETRPQESHYA